MTKRRRNPKPSQLQQWAAWATIIGLIVAILSLIVTYLQWQTSIASGRPIIPETPSPLPATSTVALITSIPTTGLIGTVLPNQEPTVNLIYTEVPEPTVKPTPTVTQTPTLISVSIQDETARDDFSDSRSGWNDYTKSNSATGYENGRYFIQLSESVLFLSVWNKVGQIDNGILQVDIYGPTQESGFRQGLGFGWHSGWEGNAYAFTVDAFGTCEFFESEDDGWYQRAKGRLFGFDTGRSYHTLQVYIRGGDVLGFIDGSFCTNYKMPNYTRGLVGVVASPSNKQNNGKFFFDEFRIYRVP